MVKTTLANICPYVEAEAFNISVPDLMSVEKYLVLD